MNSENTVVCISSLEEMVKSHNDLLNAHNRLAIAHNRSMVDIRKDVDMIMKHVNKSKLIGAVALIGSLYSIKKIKELSDKVDRLQESQANLKREYVRSQAGKEDKFE